MDYHNNTHSANAELFRVDASDLRMVNRLLALCALILAVFLMVSARRIETLEVSEGVGRSGAPYVPATPSAFADEDEYLAVAAGRNLFLSTRGEDPETHEIPEMVPRDVALRELQRVKQNVMVVGVAWRPPEVVMLYDKSRNRTYHVRSGQRIGAGEVMVKSISRNEIIIGLQDEELSL